MKWIIRGLALTCALNLTVGCARPEERVFTSTDGLHDIHVRGSFGPTDNMLLSSKVKAIVRDKRTSAVADLGTIYEFDAGDTPFDRAYGSRGWISSRILRFSHNSDPPRDRLTVANATGERLPVVFCNVGDLVFLLDLEVGARVEASVRGTQNAGVLFVNARAKLSDGTLLSQEQNLQALRPDAVNHYQIAVERTGIRITAYLKNP